MATTLRRPRLKRCCRSQKVLTPSRSLIANTTARCSPTERRLQTVSLRYFNVFGPRQNPNSQYAAAVPIFIDRAVNHEPIIIFGDGEQTRDFIFVKDVVVANVFLGTQSQETGIFNVAYGRETTINHLAANICSITGSQSVIKHAADRPGDVKHSIAAVDKLHAAGFKPAGTVEEGLNTLSRPTRDMTHVK